MKEALVHPDGQTVTIVDSPVPTPKENQLLIKVVVAGTNPKDWKMPPHYPPDHSPFNQGDDMAGYVERLGPGVRGFAVGDKVAAFHRVTGEHGAWAEFALAEANTVFHLGEGTSFEEAATIPLTAATAALGLYQQMRLPLPWNPLPDNEKFPLIIYGGATAVGAFAIKLASLSNIHPLITIAGKGIPYVESLIDRSKGDVIIDYRQGDDKIRQKIKNALGDHMIHYAYDAVSEHGSIQNIGAVLSAPGEIASVLPPGDYEAPSIKIEQRYAGSVHMPPRDGAVTGDQEFGTAIFRFIEKGLEKGWFSGHPFGVRPGGLAGLEGALKDLKEGKASAVKYVVRIGETEGVDAARV
ncbi:chaperonin 10-like protein [Aspergillus filifer]